ncbi:bifunctional DNA primase/polymerase [Micromonospora sp. BRA006-A]|uniref:bifunctional DNA primase/polymerase n=1 Tax=Micromonospora sp. BRA006-A TaxID=2962860 RepID=UPI00296F132F|nr:bifunctional DNA primase/polymerase [Micromonospora sp. BRA006-A]MDW3849676.1 bifunctional DNA primase/polymerase [Micromonospora sp. BRA006-A]
MSEPSTDLATAADITEAARRWHTAGFCVLPAKADGTKRPDVPSWTRYQHEQPSTQQMRAWFDGTGRTGLGVVTGSISGGLEMFELEGRAIADGARDRLVPALKAAGVIEVWRHLTRSGYAEWSPSGGLHILYRITDHPVPGNKKVAERPARPDELTDQERNVLRRKPNKVFTRVLAETRGEGGFVVVAPSHGTTHETGKPWSFSGDSTPGLVPTITWEQRVALFAAIHAALDEMPEPEPIQSRDPRPRDDSDGERPGDAWARQTPWDDILTPHGWQLVHRQGDMDFWRRPGKRIGWSARTGGTHDGLYVWSTSTEFPTEVSITKFRAFAILNHGGDDRSAASDLRRAGYGDRTRPAPTSVPAPAAVVAEPEPDVAEPAAGPTEPAGPGGPPWPTLGQDAMLGLAGDFVRLYDPHTEADPAAVLHAFLATVGCRFGYGYWIAGGNTRHAPKVWPVITGETATGAKGTAIAVVKSFWREFDSHFMLMNTATGLSTGEGLIRAVRDANGDDPSAPGFDEGVHDKRLWVDAPEFASVLEKSRREGNSLSGTLREAYDAGVLQSMTSGSPLKATNTHIVITPQVTPAELVAKLTATDVANGLANRFMIVASRMSKVLPEGSAPDPDALHAFGDRLNQVATGLFKACRDQAELTRTPAARDLWTAEYHRRFEERRKQSESPVKSLLARWHANSARLSVIYALLDGCLKVDEVHVRAALAAWDYVEDSTRYVFGSEAGDRDLGRLMEYVNESAGRSRTDISVDLFARHKTKAELDLLLEKLLARGGYGVKKVPGPNGGRPATRYVRLAGS